MTRVFLKDALQKQLEAKMAPALRRYVHTVQRRWRGAKARRQSRKTKFEIRVD